MAKKTKTDLDDFDFDDDMFGDFGDDGDGGGKTPKKGPVRVLSSSFAEGARDALMEPSKIKELTRGVLPKSYGSTFDAIDATADVSRRLYDTAATELKPMMPAIRKAAAKLADKSEAVLPKALHNRLKEFSERSDSSYRSATQEESDNTQIADELGSIFKASADVEAKRSATERSERYLRERVTDKQTASMFGELSRLNNSNNRMVAYQDAITYKYQQKTLENSYRQTFMLRDLLAGQGQSNAMLKEGLKNLVHNTATPDFQKKGVGDSMHESLRDKLLSGAQSQASKFTGDFFKKLTSGAHDRFKETLSGMVEGADQAQSMAEMVADQEENGIEGGRLGMAGSGIGGIVADWLMPKVLMPFQKLIGRSKGVVEGGNKLQNMLSQIPEKIQRMKDEGVDDMTSFSGWMKQLMLDVMPDYSLKKTVGGSAVMKAEQPVPFDNLSRRSLIEIIPGFLSRIHHEVANIRSGMGFTLSTERVVYNADSNKFDTMKGAASDAKKRILDPGMMYSVQSSINTVVDHSDDGTLTANQRKLMAAKLLEASQQAQPMDDKLFSKERMGADIPEKDRKAIEASFQKTLQGDDGKLDYGKLNERVTKHIEVRSHTQDPAALMRLYRETGNVEQLRELGIIKHNGFSEEVDYAAYNKLVMEGEGIEKKKKPEKEDWFKGKEREYMETWERKSEEMADWIESKEMYQKATGWFSKVFGAGIDRATKIAERFTSEEKDPYAEFDEEYGPVEEVEIDAAAEAAAVVSGKPAPRRKGKPKKKQAKFKHGRPQTRYYRGANSEPLTEQILTELKATTETLRGLKMPTLEELKAQGKGLVDKGSSLFTAGKDKFNEEHGETLDAASKAAQTQLDRLKGTKAGQKAVAATNNTTAYLNQKKQQTASVVNSIQNLYVEGGKEALLDAGKLKAGHYRDQLTGNVVRHLQDINGPVVDENGNPAITTEQIARGLYNEAGQKVNSVTKRVAAKARGMKAAAVQAGVNVSQRVAPHLQPPATAEAQVQQENDTVSMTNKHLVDIAELNSGQLALLDQIYQTMSQFDFSGGGGAAGTAQTSAPTARPGFMKRWFGHAGTAADGAGRAAWGATKGYGRFAKSVIKGQFAVVGLAGKGAWGATKGVVGGAWNVISPSANRKKRQSDVYVKGDMRNPVLFKKLMADGAYHDVKSDKPVRTVDDITGPVKNLTSGANALTQEDYDKGITDNVGASVGTKIGKAVSGIMGAFAGYSGNVLALPFKLGSQAIKLVGKTAEMINEGQDIYLKGRLNDAVMLNKHLKAGLYWSSKKQKPIFSYKDVDGEIFFLNPSTKEKRVVITEDEFLTLPLVNYRGKPIRTIGQKGMGMVGSAVGLAASSAIGLAKGYAKVIGGVMGMGRDIVVGTAKGVGRFFNPKGVNGREAVDADGRQIRILEDIFGLLQDRLAIPEKLRKGSWQEQFDKREADEAANDPDGKKGGGKGGILDGLKGLFSRGKKGLMGLFGSDDDEDDEDDDSLLDDGMDAISTADDLGDINDRRRRAKALRARKKAARKRLKRMRGRGKVSRIRNLFSRGTGAAGTAAKAGGTAARVGGSAAGAGLAGAGLATAGVGLAAGLGGGYLGAKASDKAMDAFGVDEDSNWRTAGGVVGGVGGGAAGLYAGSAALGAVGGVSGLAGAAGTAAAAVGAILAAPVVLGALAVGAVGYGAYKLYKSYKKRSDEPFRKLRLAQYGVNYKNIAQLDQVEQLEDICNASVKMTPNGAQLDQSSLDPDAIFSLFDVDSGGFLGFFKKRSESRAQSFTRWFNTRFKPVFLTWKTALHTATGGKVTELADAWSKPDYEQRKKILPMTKVSEETYSQGTSPFGDSEIETGSRNVKSYYDDAMAAIEKDKSKGVIASKISSFTDPVTGRVKKAYAGGLGMAATGLEWLADKTKFLPIPVSFLSKWSAKLLRKGEKELDPAAGEGKPLETGLTAGTRLTPLQSIRYRAYGLIGMQTDRVNAVYILEKNVMKFVTFAASGAATFTKTGSSVFNDFAIYFGIATDEYLKKRAWLEWFNKRFLPTLLAFASGARAFVKGTIDIVNIDKTLKPAQLIGIARVVIAAKCKRKLIADASIWSYLTSPWGDDEDLNDNIDTTRRNIEQLEQMAKNEKMTEMSDSASPKPVTPPSAVAERDKSVKKSPIPDTPPRTTEAGKATSAPVDGERDLAREADAAYWAKKGVGAGAISMVDNRMVDGFVPLAKGKSLPGLNTDALWNKVSPLIASGESMGGNYDAQNGVPGNVMKGLSAMTIGAVYDLSKQIGNSDNVGGRNGPKTGAAGKYQFIPSTLLMVMKQAGLKLSDIFSPENQEKLARTLFDSKVAIGAKNGVTGILDGLASTWASLPSPSKGGRSWYEGDSAGNRAHGGMERLQELIAAVNDSAASGVGNGLLSGMQGKPDPSSVAPKSDAPKNGANIPTAPTGKPSAAGAAAKPNFGNVEGGSSSSEDSNSFWARASRTALRAGTAPMRMAAQAVTMPIRQTYGMLSGAGRALGNAAYEVSQTAQSGYNAMTGYAVEAKPDTVKSAANGAVGNNTAAKAAAICTSKATVGSRGICARAVADGLVACGYKFNRQGSAYMYAANGVLESMGWTQVDPSSQPMPGDIIVYDRSPAHKHGHIQIFNGTQWISDFKQRSIIPWGNKHPSNVPPRTMWRDTSGGKAAAAATAAPAAPAVMQAPMNPDIAQPTGLQQLQVARDQSGQENAGRDDQVQQLNDQSAYQKSMQQQRGQIEGGEISRLAAQSLDVQVRQLESLDKIYNRLGDVVEAVKAIEVPAPAAKAETPEAKVEPAPSRGAKRSPPPFEQRPSRSPMNVRRAVLRK